MPVDAVESVGWDGDALEAQCFGFLAARVAAGLPLSFPGTTRVQPRRCRAAGSSRDDGGTTGSGGPEILLINPNTSARTLDMMIAAAAPHVSSRLSLRGVLAASGVPMIVDQAQLSAAATEVVRLGEAEAPRVAAIVVAAFGDPGVASLRDLVSVPVIGIGEASIREAAAGGRRFGIATTTPALVGAIERLVEALDLHRSFTGVRIPAAHPLELAADAPRQEAALAKAAEQCFEQDGADAVIIGGGPLSAAARALRDRFSAGLIEPVPAAI